MERMTIKEVCDWWVLLCEENDIFHHIDVYRRFAQVLFINRDIENHRYRLIAWDGTRIATLYIKTDLAVLYVEDLNDGDS